MLDMCSVNNIPTEPSFDHSLGDMTTKTWHLIGKRFCSTAAADRKRISTGHRQHGIASSMCGDAVGEIWASVTSTEDKASRPSGMDLCLENG